MIGLTKREEKLIISLQQKKFRNQEGLFVVEGIKMVEEALDSNFKIDICATAKYLNDQKEYETLFYKNISSSNLLGAISNRERDVIRLLISGKTSVEIAEKLCLSVHTINTHRRNILRKLNLKSTIEIVNYFNTNLTLI